MLTETEKEILGYMVDAGFLRGEERKSVASNDAIAKELIAQFKQNSLIALPQTIEALSIQEHRARIDKEKLIAILTVLQSYKTRYS